MSSEFHRFVYRLIVTLIAVVALLLVWTTLHIFLLIFMSIILAIFLRRSGAWVAAKAGIGLRWGTGIVLLLLIAALIVAVLTMAPQIGEQMDALADELPNSWRQLQEALARTRLGGWLIDHLPPLQQISGRLGGLMHQATAWLYSAVGALTGLLIVLIMGLYLAFDADLYVRGFRRLTAKGRRERTDRVLQALGATLYWWLIGRLCSMLLIGGLTFTGLLLLGVPLALSLGLFAAVMTFIPNLGPVIGLIPAVLLALQQGWTRAAYVVIMYAAIQSVESYLVTPLIQRRMIALPPALILAAQLLMGVLQGLLGILMATPLLAVVIVLTKLLYLESVLDDRQVEIHAEAVHSD